jgi:hypothetical protein
MIVFEDGHPKRSDYRRFRIRLGDEPNDYAMMHEVLSRRLRAAVSGNVKFATLPDLILVDGGLGQLNVAVRALADLDLSLPAAGLAKERELIFVPGREHAVLPVHSRTAPAAACAMRRTGSLAYHQSLRTPGARECSTPFPASGAQRGCSRGSDSAQAAEAPWRRSPQPAWSPEVAQGSSRGPVGHLADSWRLLSSQSATEARSRRLPDLLSGGLQR